MVVGLFGGEDDKQETERGNDWGPGIIFKVVTPVTDFTYLRTYHLKFPEPPKNRDIASNQVFNT
jgi:hypothetical protein